MGILETAWAVAFFCISTGAVGRVGYLANAGSDDYGDRTAEVSVIVWLASLLMGATIVFEDGAAASLWQTTCSWMRHYSTSDGAAVATAGIALLFGCSLLMTVHFTLSFGLGWIVSSVKERRRLASMLGQRN